MPTSDLDMTVNVMIPEWINSITITPNIVWNGTTSAAPCPIEIGGEITAIPPFHFCQTPVVFDDIVIPMEFRPIPSETVNIMADFIRMMNEMNKRILGATKALENHPKSRLKNSHWIESEDGLVCSILASFLLNCGLLGPNNDPLPVFVAIDAGEIIGWESDPFTMLGETFILYVQNDLRDDTSIKELNQKICEQKH